MLFLVLFSFGHVQGTEVSRPLRIACLDDPSSTMNLSAFDLQLLRDYLLNRSDVADALKANNYSGITVLNLNTPENLLHLLRYDGADIVFCPLSLYLSSIPIHYHPVYQIYEGAFIDQRMIIFRNPALPDPNHSPNVKAAVSFWDIKSQPQLLSALRQCIDAEKFEFVYFSNPYDIAKTVLCGLIPVGICEKKVLDTVLQEAWVDLSQEDVVEVINELDLLPLDPILFHDSLDSENNKILKKQLRIAISQFFTTQPSNLSIVPVDKLDMQDIISKYRDQVTKLFQKALETTSPAREAGRNLLIP